MLALHSSDFQVKALSNIGEERRKKRNLPENVFIMKKVSSVFISYKIRLFFQSPDNRITL